MREISPICLWSSIHCWDWPQTTGSHYGQVAEWLSPKNTENAHQATKIWRDFNLHTGQVLVCRRRPVPCCRQTRENRNLRCWNQRLCDTVVASLPVSADRMDQTNMRQKRMKQWENWRWLFKKDDQEKKETVPWELGITGLADQTSL